MRLFATIVVNPRLVAQHQAEGYSLTGEDGLHDRWFAGCQVCRLVAWKL
jgi:hypothetical protein